MYITLEILSFGINVNSEEKGHKQTQYELIENLDVFNNVFNF